MIKYYKNVAANIFQKSALRNCVLIFLNYFKNKMYSLKNKINTGKYYCYSAIVY